MHEWRLQARVHTELSRLGILHHGDQNAGKRGPRAASIAKATGMCRGWPDMTVIPRRSEIFFIEYKTSDGKISKDQKNIHKAMSDFGFAVHTIFADTEDEAWRLTREVLGL